MPREAKAWDEATVLAFRAFVRVRGGDVKLPVRITNAGGIEAEVIPPKDASPGWGQSCLDEFEKQR